MNKRWTSFLMTVLLLATNCFFPVKVMAAEKSNCIQGVSDEVLTAYYNVWSEEMMDDLGIIDVTSRGCSDEVIFIDLDDDKYHEMLFADSDGEYVLYTYKNGEAKEVSYTCEFGNGQNEYLKFGFITVGSRKYLCEYLISYMGSDWVSDSIKQNNGEYTTKIYMLKGDTIELVEEFNRHRTSYQEFGISDPEFELYKDVVEENFYIGNYKNRIEISQDEYYKMFSKYGKVTKETWDNYTPPCTTEKMSQNIANEWKKIAEEYRYNNIGFENVFDTMSEDKKSEIVNYILKFSEGPITEFDIGNFEGSCINDFCQVIYRKKYKDYRERYPNAEEVINCEDRTIRCTYMSEEDFYDITLDYFGRKIKPTENEYFFKKDGLYYDENPGFGDFIGYNRVNEIYDLGNEIYYLICTETDLVSFLGACMSGDNGTEEDYLDILDNLDKPIEQWPEHLRKMLEDAHFSERTAYTIIQKSGDGYQLLKRTYDCFTNEELEQYLEKVLPASNITFDYKKIANTADLNVFIRTLDDVLAKEKPNTSALTEIRKYIEYCLSKSSVVDLPTKSNDVVIKQSTIEKAISSNNEANKEFQHVLNKHSVTLNREVEKTVYVNAKGLNVGKKVKVSFADLNMDKLKGVDAITVYLGGNHYGLSFKRADIDGLIDIYKKFSVQMQKKKDTCVLKFLDREGKEIEQVSNPITIILPEESALASVFLNRKDFSENLGGQYDENNQAIFFMAKDTGEYSVFVQEVEIGDLLEYTEEEQKAIQFMVSKGYFDLIDGDFEGYDNLSRNEFTKAMVKIFYATNQTVETTFTDVSKESPYYVFIASSQKDGIVKGYDDNTFKGEVFIPKEEVISLCGRILSDKMGYHYPENVEAYVDFVDRGYIGDWAVSDIAVSVENGLLKNGGILLPQMDMSRKEAAVVLYNLFMLMYELDSVEIMVGDTSVTSRNTGMISGVGVIIMAGGLGFYYWNKKKKNPIGVISTEQVGEVTEDTQELL